jgi:hypothetical protein
MKTVIVRACALMVAALSCAQLEAAPITFHSGDGGDIANGSAAVLIDPHPLWGDVSAPAGLLPETARWISYTDTGYGRLVAPNADSRDLGHQTAVFSRTFDLLSASSLSLWVLADDTATVRLFGPGGYLKTLFTAYPGQVDPCAPGGTGAGLGCVQADMGWATESNLEAGSYTLEVNAFQTNGNVFGAQYAGTITPVPEPTTLLLMGAGVGALAIRRRFQGRRQLAS